MKRSVQILLLFSAIAVNVTLAAANVSAHAAPPVCPQWRACQCYENGDPEGCCAVCASSCNGCAVNPIKPIVEGLIH